MRSFEEIIKDCIDNRTNPSIFKNYCSEFLKLPEIEIFSKTYKNDKNIPAVKKLCFFENKLNEIDIWGDITETLANRNFKDNPPKFSTFKNAVVEILAKRLKNNSTDELKVKIKNYQKRKKNKENNLDEEGLTFEEELNLDDIRTHNLGIVSIRSKDENIADDYTFEETIEGDDNVEDNAEDNERSDFVRKLENIEITNERDQAIIGFICHSENTFKDLQDIMDKLYEFSKKNNIKQNILPKKIKEIEKLISTCYKRDAKNIGAIINSRISPSVYAELINYLIKITVKNDKKEDQTVKLKENNKEEEKLQVEKIHLEKLILDFNKIRNYLFVLLNNDDIKDKKSFIKKSKLGSVSSYEKESRRILDLFKQQGNFFELKDELKEYKPSEFLKIYDIHTVPNIVINFLILYIFQKFKENDSIKIQDLIKELFFKNKKFNDNHIKTFRKYTLLPRINEMNEYGFINKIDNDKYSLKARVLDNIQKNALKYAVPFFCAVYPFSSIGHFLANRLDIDDKFAIEPYNISNILEDCIAYDLLYAINNKEDIKPVFKNKDNIEAFSPKELLIDNKKGLLKVRDNKKEYYLHEIDEINFKNKDNDFNIKSQNPIFSEIYSFYYKVFEDAIKIYKQVHDENEVCKEIKKKYQSKSKYNLILDDSDLKSLLMPQNPDKKCTDEKKNNIRPSILKIMANIEGIENVSIPLTTLELRWLKTIMQDPRFDLFVSEKEKQCLKELVDDVEVFDLSAFKVYDYNEKKYTNIINKTLIKNINKMDKEKFRKQLKELNSIPYSLKDNCFPETNK